MRSSTRIAGIDHLRAIAAGAVFVAHLFGLVLQNPAPSRKEIWPQFHDTIQTLIMSLGGFGVGLFFVLSGLCIHLPVARGDHFDLRSYLRRRFLRIYPPHAIILLASCVLAMAIDPPHLGIPDRMLSTPTWRQLLAHVLMVHSFFRWAIYSINGILWTIAIETHFYLLYPLLLAARRRFPMPAITVALLVLCLVSRAMKRYAFPDSDFVVYDSFLGRWWEWALGCIVAELIVLRPAPKPLSMLAWGALLFSLPWPSRCQATSLQRQRSC